LTGGQNMVDFPSIPYEQVGIRLSAKASNDAVIVDTNAVVAESSSVKQAEAKPKATETQAVNSATHIGDEIGAQPATEDIGDIVSAAIVSDTASQADVIVTELDAVEEKIAVAEIPKDIAESTMQEVAEPQPQIEEVATTKTVAVEVESPNDTAAVLEQPPVQEKTEKQSAASTTLALVSISTATYEQLVKLTGIGPKRAEAIIAYRETVSAFETVTDIQNVPGISERLYVRFAAEICL